MSTPSTEKVLDSSSTTPHSDRSTQAGGLVSTQWDVRRSGWLRTKLPKLSQITNNAPSKIEHLSTPEAKAVLQQADSIKQHDHILRSKIASQKTQLSLLRKRLNQKNPAEEELTDQVDELTHRVIAEKSLSRAIHKKVNMTETRYMATRKEQLQLQDELDQERRIHQKLEEHILLLQNEVKEYEKKHEESCTAIEHLQLQVDN